MGFFGNMLSAAVKTASLPVAIVADVATMGKGEHTKKTIESAREDVEDAFMGY